MLITTAPVLVMPNNTGAFSLFSDTSKIACGSALYQEQKGEHRLVAYYSKKLPDAASRYSISELELCGLVANISAFKHVLRNTNFTVYVDHSALVHILRAKSEPPTLRIKNLIEHLSEYSFVVKYWKGDDMKVADLLSRHPDNDLDSPNEIIPISFVMSDILHDNKNIDKIVSMINMNNHECDRCMVITRGMTKIAQAKVPPIQSSTKKPEYSKQPVIDLTQKVAKAEPVFTPNQLPQPVNGQTPKVGKIRLKKVGEGWQIAHPEKDTPNTIVNEPEVAQTIHQQKQNAGYVDKQKQMPKQIAQPLSQTLMKPQIPGEIKPIARLPYEGISHILNPVPINVTLRGQLPSFDDDKEDIDLPDITLSDDMKQRNSFLLIGQILDSNIFRHHIPKQVELDKFLQILKKKVIHDYSLPISIKELRAEYPNSPFFKDIYRYIVKGSCSFTGNAMRVFKAECEDYIVFDRVLFRIKLDKNK